MLAFGPPGGAFERDADRVAAQVTRVLEPRGTLQRLPEEVIQNRELARAAEELDDEALQERILDLVTGIATPAPFGGFMTSIEERRSRELEVLRAEVRRRQRRDERLFIERLASSFDQMQLGGWHRVLPASTATGLDVEPGGEAEGSTPRSEPSIRYPATTLPGLQRLGRGRGPWIERAREIYLAEVRRRLAAVPIPTASGQLRLWGGRERRARNELVGYVWGINEDLPAGTRDDYRDFWRQAMAARTIEDAAAVGVPLSDREDLNFWNVFRFITSEGDIASINTWDDRLLTIGAGWAARGAGNAQGVYARMPPAFHEHLYRHGIYLDPETRDFVVLDLDRGAVVRGDDALHLLQVDQRRLALLIQLAMSPETMSRGEGAAREEAPARVWMLRAQFEQFRHSNRAVRSPVWTWDRNHVRFAFLLHHWMGSLDWPGMMRTGGNPRAVAEYAYRRLRTRRPSADPARLWRRIQGAAGRAHAGPIGAQPEPE